MLREEAQLQEVSTSERLGPSWGWELCHFGVIPIQDLLGREPSGGAEHYMENLQYGQNELQGKQWRGLTRDGPTWGLLHAGASGRRPRSRPSVRRQQSRGI